MPLSSVSHPQESDIVNSNFIREYTLATPLLIAIIRLCYYLYLHKKVDTDAQVIKCWLEILYSFWWIIFLVMLIFWSILKHPFNPVITTVPLVISYIAYLWSAKWPDTPFLSLVHIVRWYTVSWRTPLIFTLMLKIGKLISWEWTTCLWIFWCWYLVLTLFSFLLFILFIYTVILSIKRMIQWPNLLASFGCFYVLFGVSQISFLIVFDVIIRYDYKYKYDYTAEERKASDDNFTSVKLHWGPSFPTKVMMIFWATVVLFSIVLYNVVVKYLEIVFYHEIFQNGWQQWRQEERPQTEVQVDNYHFKSPPIIRKVNNTYFKKGQQEDVDRMQDKVQQMLKRYKTRQSMYSIDLENMMRDRDFEKQSKNISGNDETNNQRKAWKSKVLLIWYL